MYHFRGTPRYAHAEGYTNLCFSECGEYIITCGSEGDVRIWHGFEDDDPQAKCVGEKAFAIVQKGDKLYVGSDHNYVQILTFPNGELDHILTRFTAAVTTIDVSKSGNIVAAGSEDMQIQIVDVSTSVVKYFSGHKAPVLNVVIDPKLEYLGSSSCDGTVKIWKIEDQTVVKEWSDVLKPSNSFQHSELLCRSSWEPSTGRLLAIPFSTEIKVMQRDTWNIIITLSDFKSPNAFSLTSWSSCGRYLAGSTSKGEICVWNTIISTLVSSSTNSSNVNISSLSWHPDSGTRQIAYCDFKGQLVSVDNCSPKPINVTEETKSKKTLIDNVTESRTDDTNSDLVSLIDDDDGSDAISLEKIKSNYNSFLGDKILEKGDDNDDLESLSSSSIGAPVLPPVELQFPFQPTSMPVHLQRRFMVFNDCGYVKQTNTEEENVIDVDFHDASIHHAIRINNILNHTMAALNTEALVLACEKTDESVSKVVCRRFNSWDGSKEWNVELPTNESVETVAAGAKWFAVATNSRFLRLFTLGGFQRELICLLGSVVSMNASDELLIVVYHSAMGLPGEQNLSFSVYQITHDVKMLVAAQPVPLNPKSTLKWVGFSDLLNPCIVDSDGVLKLFISDSGLWKPICLVHERGKESSSHHFIIGVSEERQNIRCISCSKGSFYPSTTPHPFICEIPWLIPLCETETDKGMLEEKLWHYSIAKECSPKDDKNLHKSYLQTALKLFSLFTKTDRLMRVYDLCDIGNQSTMTELALKYASKLNNSLLVKKLSQLKEEQNEGHMDPELSEERYIDSSNSDYNYNRSYDDRRRIQENEQSQELFPESSFTDSNGTQASGSVSLIAETKRMINLNELRPILHTRKINPFKKSTPYDSASNSVSENCDSISSPVIESKKDSLDRPFSEWFKLEKENLKQEFPDVDVTELARRGAKKYNLLKKNRQSVIENKDVGGTEKDNNCGTENKKRKITEEDTTNNAEKPLLKKKLPLFKLQAFAFKSSQ